MKGLQAVAVAPIRFYQRFVSPALPRRCKYEPTCSHYAAQAVRDYGILRGVRPRGLAAAEMQPLESWRS